MKEIMIEYLLNNAGPSIKLRVKKEILKDITEIEEQELQEIISNEKILIFVAEKQQDNGWIGLGFHGSSKNAGRYDNQETATKYMGEKGLKGTDILNKAMDAFVTTELTDLCYETKGRYYSEFEIAAFGQNMIRCACIARAHYDDVIDITPQIEVALESFKRVTEVDSIFDVSRPSKNGRLFNDKERWPCRYHLEILSFTDSWKNSDNIDILADAFNRLMRTDRKEYIDIDIYCWIGYAIGPLWRFTEGYAIAADNGGTHIINLEKVEWMVRCGLYHHVPKLKEEIDYILNAIDQYGSCGIEINEKEFRGWGPYSGLQLETDWKVKVRRTCDITFRALLILHYAQIS